MKKIISIISLCFFLQTLNAQQSTSLNLYAQNMFLYNPAAAGFNTNFHAFMHHVSSTAEFEDAAQNLVFGAHGSVAENMGIGALVTANSYGLFENQQALFAYSYRIKLGEKNALRFGISAGAQKSFLNSSKLVVFDNGDANLLPELYTKAGFFTGFGLNLTFQNINLDLSAPNLYDTQTQQTLEVMAGGLSYNLLAMNKSLLVQPSVFVKMDKNSPMILDGYLLVSFKQMVWTQAGYRHNRGIMAGMGIAIKGMGIAYAYGFNTGVLSQLAGGSHEIMVSFQK